MLKFSLTGIPDFNKRVLATKSPRHEGSQRNPELNVVKLRVFNLRGKFAVNLFTCGLVLATKGAKLKVSQKKDRTKRCEP
jgi:hypothetical protein